MFPFALEAQVSVVVAASKGLKLSDHKKGQRGI